MGIKERQRAYKLYTEERSLNQSCRERAINITYSKCVSVALVIQHAKGMCHIMLPSMACPALQYFSSHLAKENVFDKLY
jgi:chemotaxis receptor (MCP) glutamine deamidase CheD